MRSATLVVAMTLVACGAPPPQVKLPPAPSPAPTASVAPRETARSPLVALLDGYRFEEGASGPTTTQVIDAVLELTRRHHQAPLGADERRAVFNLFLRLHASLPRAKAMFRPVNAAIIAIADPSWEDEMIARLEVPVASARAEHTNDVIDQVYWQVTAAQVLGQLRSTKAIPALLRVLLSPFKGNVEGTATAALIHIGSPVIPFAKGLVEGSDSGLVGYAEAEYLRAMADEGEPIDAGARAEAKEAHIDVGLTVLASLGTKAAREVVVAALRAPNKATRQRAAAELFRLPKTPAFVASLKPIYQETGVADQLRNGDYAKEALLGCAANLFEPGLAAWLVDDALRLPESTDATGVQVAVLSLALREVPKAEWGKVQKLFQKLAAKTKGAQPTLPAKEWVRYQTAYDQAQALIARCGDDAGCHREVLVEPTPSGPSSMTMFRAATMAMLLGNGEQALPLWGRVTADEPRHILAAAIGSFSPDGNIAAAEAFEKAVDEARAQQDVERIAQLQPFLLLAAILRARATP